MVGEGTIDWREDHKFIILVSLCVRQRRQKILGDPRGAHNLGDFLRGSKGNTRVS